jgi:hypothetical protein
MILTRVDPFRISLETPIPLLAMSIAAQADLLPRAAARSDAQPF